MKNFQQLIHTIKETHNQLQSRAVNAVNQALTIRNWLIGFYIVEFEQNGEDKAEYGAKLIDSLSEKLKDIKGINRRSLFRFRTFYLAYSYWYSYLVQSEEFSKLLEKPVLIRKVVTVSPQLDQKGLIPPERLIQRLSYSHLELLINFEDPLKRIFYELECIKGTWGVRELKRQINSLYYERSGLSVNPEKLGKLVHEKTTPLQPTDIIKNIYAFEFLELRSKEIVEESDLETALLDHLQNFIIELGNGFCLEARQKRILIGDNYYYIDLLFYHRILKCHILIELKIGKFEHGDIGQLNTYLNYFKAEICEETDNPPIGILLVAEKDHALVKYATAGMDENLFVQQYLIKLPSVKQLQEYIEKELKGLI